LPCRCQNRRNNDSRPLFPSGPVYGHETAYGVGQVAGTVTGVVGSLIVGNVAAGASGLIACGSLLQRGAKLYTAADTALSLGAAGVNAYNGEAGLGDALALASGAGYLGAKLRGAATNCFVAGTMVLVDDGAGGVASVPIEEVEVGDLVWSRDEADPDAPLQLRPVTNLYRRVADDVRSLSLADEGGNIEHLSVTGEHPFWVEGRGWVEAGALLPGEVVAGTDDALLTVVANGLAQGVDAGGVLVYNFEVAGGHTYFVADGVGEEAWVWTHNLCDSEQLARNLGNQVAHRATGDQAAHLVASGDKRAAASRKLLNGAEIDINDADNGIWLPGSKLIQKLRSKLTGSKIVYHGQTHTNDFHQTLFNLLKAHEGDEAAMRQILRDVASDLTKGILPAYP
jgi:hypothetical protein